MAELVLDHRPHRRGAVEPLLQMHARVDHDHPAHELRGVEPARHRERDAERVPDPQLAHRRSGAERDQDRGPPQAAPLFRHEASGVEEVADGPVHHAVELEPETAGLARAPNCLPHVVDDPVADPSRIDLVVDRGAGIPAERAAGRRAPDEGVGAFAAEERPGVAPGGLGGHDARDPGEHDHRETQDEGEERVASAARRGWVRGPARGRREREVRVRGGWGRELEPVHRCVRSRSRRVLLRSIGRRATPLESRWRRGRRIQSGAPSGSTRAA